MRQTLFEAIKNINNIRILKKSNIDVSKPHKTGVTVTKRETPIIISLTSYPARIESAYKTIRTLLHQSYLPDRIILWLAKEQFVSETALPSNLLELKKYGLEEIIEIDTGEYKIIGYFILIKIFSQTINCILFNSRNLCLTYS